MLCYGSGSPCAAGAAAPRRIAGARRVHMLGSFSVQALSAGLLASFVGFASTFAVIIRALTAVGASAEEAASGLMALSISMGASAIPAPLANAMLAGVLLGLCLAPVRAVAQTPILGLTIVAAWAVVGRIRRLYAVPVAVLVTIGLIVATTPVSPASFGSLW